MRIINNIEYPVVDSKGGNCYKNQNYKIFWHLFYQMENLANIYPFLSQMEHRYFSFKKHGISECKLGLDIAKSFNPKISQFKQALIGIVFY